MMMNLHFFASQVRARLRKRVTLAVICVCLPVAAQAACAPDQVDVRTDGSEVRFTVDVAATPADRAQGLMNVPSLPQFSGMIFFYETPRSAAFWMKNTLIPLDMLFADETGTITRIHENAEPMSTDTIPGGDGVLAVLEINGGLSAMLGFEVGGQLRHPMFDQSIAAFPCE